MSNKAVSKQELVAKIGALVAAYQDGASIGDKRFDRLTGPVDFAAFLVDRLRLVSTV